MDLNPEQPLYQFKRHTGNSELLPKYPRVQSTEEKLSFDELFAYLNEKIQEAIHLQNEIKSKYPDEFPFEQYLAIPSGCCFHPWNLNSKLEEIDQFVKDAKTFLYFR